MLKIADFGYSRLHGLILHKKEKAYNVTPRMDPKILNYHSSDLTTNLYI